MRDGATAGFKLFDLSGVTAISATVSCLGSGKLEIRTRLGDFPIGEIPVKEKEGTQTVVAQIKTVDSVTPLYFTYRGTSAVDFWAFTLINE